MFSYNSLRLTTRKQDRRIIHADNISTYLTFSDGTNEFDGLWSYGFHVFRDIWPGTEKHAVIEKSCSPDMLRVTSQKGTTVSYHLFKKGNGLVIDCNDKGILPGATRKGVYTIEIPESFEIVEKNISTVIIKFDKPARLGFGLSQLYCSIHAVNENSIEDARKVHGNLRLQLKSKRRRGIGKLYIYYSGDYSHLKEQDERNIDRLDILFKQHERNCLLPMQYTGFSTEYGRFNKALGWALYAADSFVMHKQDKIGIWAGYPWFDNTWGRDTFIAMPGITLVTGRYEDAWRIIETFCEFQNRNKRSPHYGKVPNLVVSEKEILYNTADGTPLFIREVYEYFLYSGDYNAIFTIWKSVEQAIEGLYLKNRDESGFVRHKNSDDWMDAKKEGKDAWSPRGDRAVEIQALWYTALHAAANIIRAIIRHAKSRMPVPDSIKVDKLQDTLKRYLQEARILKNSFQNRFVIDTAPFIHDHLEKEESPGTHIRPNGFLAIYYSSLQGVPPLIDRKTAIQYCRYMMPRLIYEYGVSSLSREDKWFHPVHMSSLFHKDAAYHNGSIWGWLSGPFITVLCRYGLSATAWKLTENITRQVLESGTLGTLSELLEVRKDESGEVVPSGAYSQAWSVSEYLRSFYQDYAGVRPDVPSRRLYLYPSLPVKLSTVKMVIRYGYNESLMIHLKVDKRISRVSYFEIRATDLREYVGVIIRLPLGYIEREGSFKYSYININAKLVATGDSFKINFETMKNSVIKLREISAAGESELVSIETESELSERLYHEGLDFSPEITTEESLHYESLKTENFLEKELGI
jgi:glycogen debranching enzyme